MPPRLSLPPDEKHGSTHAMDHPTSPPLPSPRSLQLKPGRRRLQKSDPKLKCLKTKRGSADSAVSLLHHGAPNVSPSGRHDSTDTPDLSDAKWSHYLRPDTLVLSPATLDLEPDERRPSADLRPSIPPPTRLAPEPPSLSLQDISLQPSLDNSSIPSPTWSTSTASTMRRQAKTPVFRIGQLEKPKAVLGREVTDRACSVELIAEQYRALLESRDGPEEIPDARSSYVDSGMQTEPLRPTVLNLKDSAMRRHHAVDNYPPQRDSLAPYIQESNGSKTPSIVADGQLPPFQDGAIYFRPILYSPPPSPEPSPSVHLQTFHPPAQPRHSSTENLGLQTCLGLLTKELSSAVGQQSQISQISPAIQIRAMIETYERLRAQIILLGLDQSQGRHVLSPFDCWLSSLRSLHASLVDGQLPGAAEVASLSEEVD